MYDLSNFLLQDMAGCGSSLRKLGDGASSMAEVADRTVRFLYDSFKDPETGSSACALVRFFKTHPYQDLDDGLQDFAQGILGAAPESATMPCLTLLATAGDRPEWSELDQSQGHRAIPLSSEQMVEQSPMIAQLIKQLGLDVSIVLQPNPALLVDIEQRTFNVFHVPDALGSPYVPAQEQFVAPFGIQSVLGFGGMLPSGNLFATILFSKVKIPRSTAEMFKTLALNIKVAILPFAAQPLFK